MADQADIETALVAAATAAIYPAGPAGPSLTGSLCRIYRGWPNAAALDSDLAAGISNVTVFPAGEPAANTTRFIDTVKTTQGTPALNVTASGLAASFAGTASPGQLAGLLIDGATYVYATQAGDTPPLVAAALAAQLRAAGHIVQLSGATLSLPMAHGFVARVVANGTSTTELRRQRQAFRISAWCPSPGARDQIAAAIDLTLAATPWLTPADGSAARLRMLPGPTYDQSQSAALYRRDLIASVEYATTSTANPAAMLFGALNLNASPQFT